MLTWLLIGLVYLGIGACCYRVGYNDGRYKEMQRAAKKLRAAETNIAEAINEARAIKQAAAEQASRQVCRYVKVYDMVNQN